MGGRWERRLRTVFWIGLVIASILGFLYWNSLQPKQVYEIRYKNVDDIAKTSYTVNYRKDISSVEFRDVRTDEEIVVSGTYEIKPYKKLKLDEIKTHKFPKEEGS
ncbi:hypothetical protein [Bacillus thuringiensis]|uniref:hypothetical protein n=1 Tax=Bacillus thuringiensis TaxID=1428 RepID=UPI000BFBE903|nr:hypothetical protein [Bacillus thuringiensis]PGT90131.1 hypothetical protein COD17_10300 [Bacillus thuringiensis]